MLGQVSSLNVSVACGILAYQWVSTYAVAVDSDAPKMMPSRARRHRFEDTSTLSFLT
jgi:hypothetical protein